MLDEWRPLPPDDAPPIIERLDNGKRLSQDDRQFVGENGVVELSNFARSSPCRHRC